MAAVFEGRCCHGLAAAALHNRVISAALINCELSDAGASLYGELITLWEDQEKWVVEFCSGCSAFRFRLSSCWRFSGINGGEPNGTCQSIGACNGRDSR